jgi:hypothetical protein
MCQLVKIAKQRRAENARSEPGRWDSYRIGRADNETSLPVDYVMIGLATKNPSSLSLADLRRLPQSRGCETGKML